MSAGAGCQCAVNMARGGPKSGGSSTMDSIAAHEGEEVGKMKRSTGEGFWSLYRKVPRGKMDKGLRTSFLSQAGNDYFNRYGIFCQINKLPVFQPANFTFSVSSSHHFPCPITNFALKKIFITHRIVF